jgi:hypothetical protein
MAKTTRTLSGASQDAYFRRVLKVCPALSAAERDEVVRRLRLEVAQVRLRLHAKAERKAEPAAPPVQIPQVTTAKVEEAASPPLAPTQRIPFDPFSPNVIVVLRKSGRDAAIAALGGIESLDDLSLLAREQRLAIPANLASPAEARAAIVTAAEQRVANRMAAAT